MDGNKRVARLTFNAVLMAHGYCPLSFRRVESVDYKKAMLIFYEQNNISQTKKPAVKNIQFACAMDIEYTKKGFEAGVSV